MGSGCGHSKGLILRCDGEEIGGQTDDNHLFEHIIIIINPGLNARRSPMSHLFLTIGEFSSYRDWLWCPGLSPVLVSIVLPFAFHTWCFPFALICLPLDFNRVSSFRPTYSHPSVDPSLTHFLGEFPGLGLALVPDVVVLVTDSEHSHGIKEQYGHENG